MIPARRLRVAMSYGVGALVLALAHPGAAGAHMAHLSAQCAHADASVRTQPLSELRAAVLCLTNAQRRAHGLPSLRASTRLDRVAERWTRWMVASRVFSHGADFARRFSAGGYDWQVAAENIAMGYATPRSVVDAWMASPEHCRNVLIPSVRDMGIGVSPESAGPGAIAPGTWTVDFGLRMGESAPSGDTTPEDGCPYR